MSLCDNLINHFNKSVTQILDDIAPFKTKKISGKSKAPWINKDQLKSLKRTCCKSERKWRKSKLQTDYFNYKELLRKYNTEVKHSRQSYFSQLIAENLNNSKLLFSTIDKLVNPPRPIPAELHSSEKCNEFASYFELKVANIRINIAATCGGACGSFSIPQSHNTNTLSDFR